MNGGGSKDSNRLATLEAENEKLKQMLNKVGNLNLLDEISRLEQANKELNEMLATEIAKNKALANGSPTSEHPANGAISKSAVAPQIRSVSVPNKITEIEKSSKRTYVAYVIQIELENNKTYTVTRRYKQFVILNTMFIRTFGEHGMPSLPQKKNGFYFSSEDHTEKRRTGLQDYLQSVLSTSGLNQSIHLYQFLKEDTPMASDSQHH
ncbi:hypothetical protein SAMD00019534_101700 [Acytostelium subglobosum LB1]|uniref:hypothetical protein n=1 Tax=Acytostelium subglobosum LB1 TaxID=1410327 RepID=UPI0006447DFB|nr:hypothetical protein SAMD00019534_101700 [Acytostelium subglobosum LB1]GAM26995.1 hypothetical protein SAMD00019534_101700 [Acytostelium subglobosum LB1]|eukprot:XP_012749875.1 hypothetical protein SAMD00019534_101700 [Acytostelium subglobosum LB1]